MEWLPVGDLLLSLSLLVGGIAAQFSFMLVVPVQRRGAKLTVINANYDWPGTVPAPHTKSNETM